MYFYLGNYFEGFADIGQYVVSGADASNLLGDYCTAKIRKNETLTLQIIYGKNRKQTKLKMLTLRPTVNPLMQKSRKQSKNKTSATV